MKKVMRIIPLVIILAIVFSSTAYSGQCQATTKKGTQCKRQASAGSVYCWQHGEKTQSTAPKETKNPNEEVKKEETQKKEYVSTQCQAITKKGTQCKRKAKAGSTYCWQHGY